MGATDTMTVVTLGTLAIIGGVSLLGVASGALKGMASRAGTNNAVLAERMQGSTTTGGTRRNKHSSRSNSRNSRRR